MQITQLNLNNFKNYQQQSLQFSGGFNCIVGQNGMGKTNLLDAIYYLCMCKSHFAYVDRDIVRHQQKWFRLDGKFIRNDHLEHIVAKVRIGQSKVFERNGLPYEKLADHVGLLPVVMIAPDDTALVKEGSELRRRFLDNTLSQIDRNYLTHLINYNRVLRQRNALLKQLGQNESVDLALLETYSHQMSQPAAYIHQKRADFITSFVTVFNRTYEKISNGNESVGCRYLSHLNEASLPQLLRSSLERDRFLQRTSKGLHRDDLKFTIDNKHLKRFASQGQLKSVVLALKLAQYDVLRKEKKLDPILLLDDIFDKLDRLRVNALLELLNQGKFGQVFLSDAHPDRTVQIIKELGMDFNIFQIKRGIALKLTQE